MKRPASRRAPPTPQRPPCAPLEPKTHLLLNSDARSGDFHLMFLSGNVNGTIFFTAAQADLLARQIVADLRDLPKRAAKVAKAMAGGVP